MRASLAKCLSSASALCVLTGAGALAQTAGHVNAPPQRTWFVDDSAAFGGSGTHGAPFRTIQQGIDAANDGDRVLVAPGTYPERIDFSGKAIAVIASEGPAQTVIGKTSGLPAFYGAVFQNGEGPDSVLDGFTVALFSGSQGAVRCFGSSPTIVRNVIRNNSGPAIRCEGCDDVRIVSNEIRANSQLFGAGGAGIFAKDSTLRIAGNKILDNYADDIGAAGAGIYLLHSTATIENNVIAGNSCQHHSGGNRGAGLYASLSSVESRGDTFTENLAATGYGGFSPGQGGAIACAGTDLIISGTILWKDAADSGPEIWASNSYVRVDHSDVQGGVGKIVSSGGALDWGDGNVITTPLFVSAINSDYRLALGSPLIDEGPPGQVAKGIDASGAPRVLDGDGDGQQRVDIGAEEYEPTTLAVAGSAKLRSTVTFTTLAPSGWSYMLFLGPRAGDTPAPPYGSYLVGLAGLRTIGSGTVPGTDVLPIPPTIALLGQEFWAQSLALAPGGQTGSLSNALRLVVH